MGGRQKAPMNMAKLIVAAKNQGWKVDRTERGHVRATSPVTGDACIASGTPGDVRAVKNFLACLYRNGFEYPTPRRKA